MDLFTNLGTHTNHPTSIHFFLGERASVWYEIYGLFRIDLNKFLLLKKLSAVEACQFLEKSYMPRDFPGPSSDPGVCIVLGFGGEVKVWAFTLQTIESALIVYTKQVSKRLRPQLTADDCCTMTQYKRRSFLISL